MNLLHRTTHKDSKTSSFIILWFFYNLLWIKQDLGDILEKEKQKIEKENNFSMVSQQISQII
jgi:hypothetical protein